MEDISSWLSNGGTFEQGMALLEKYSRSRHMTGMIRRRRDMQKLRYELGKFLPRPVITTPVHTFHDARTSKQAASSETRLRITRKGAVRFEELPELLKERYSTAVECHRRMRSLHERMKIAQTDRERASLRAEIDDLDARRRECWRVIDQWAEDGIIPGTALEPGVTAEEGTPKPDAAAVIKARSRITRGLRTLSKESDPKRAKELKARISEAVQTVLAGGGKFDKLLGPLREHGIIDT